MRRDQWFFLILMTALAARVLFLLALAHPEARSGPLVLPDYASGAQAASDETDYHLLALHLAESGRLKLSSNGPPTATRSPGTVLPIAMLYLLFGPRPILGVAFVILCSLLIVVVVGALAREAGGDLAAQRLAMLIAAVTPTLVFVGSGIWSDTPAVLFSLLSLLLILKARRRDGERWLVIMAALCLGLAYLNRPSAGFAAVLIAGLLWIEGWRRKDLITPLLFVGVVAVPVAGWGLWNLAHLGSFFTGNTTATATLWQANNPVTAGLRPPAMRHANGVDLYQEAEQGRYRGSWVPLRYVAPHDPWTDRSLPEMEAEAWLRGRISSFVRDNPGSFLQLLGYKALRIFTAQPTAPSVLAESPGKRRLKHLMTFAERWFFLILGSLGMVLLWRQWRSHALHYLLYCVAGLVTVFAAYPNARILLPVTATLIVPAAIAIVWIWNRLVPGNST